MGPWWLLLSSRPNEEFHAFLADLLDQQRPLCAPPRSSPVPPSVASRCTAETTRPGETDSLGVWIMMRLLTFFRPPRLGIMRNKNENVRMTRNGNPAPSRSSYLILSYLSLSN